MNRPQNREELLEEMVAMACEDWKWGRSSNPNSNPHHERIDNVDYIKIPLPNSNSNWTFDAFRTAWNLCEKYDGTGRGVYIIHHKELALHTALFVLVG